MVEMSKDQVVGVIPVRWKSSRYPGKPLVDILGKSLIQRTYENARQSKRLDRLVVATDDARIFDHVKTFGGEVYMSSEACPTGTDRVCEVVHKHLPEASIVVNIQGDEPCLSSDVLDALVECLVSAPEGVISTPITPIIDPQDIFSPSAVKCVFDKEGRALYFSRAPIPFPHNTDGMHTYYRHLGVYCFRRAFLERFAQMEKTRLQGIEDLEQLKILEMGFPIHVTVVESAGIGVDTPEDLKRVEEHLCANTSS